MRRVASGRFGELRARGPPASSRQRKTQGRPLQRRAQASGLSSQRRRRRGRKRRNARPRLRRHPRIRERSACFLQVPLGGARVHEVAQAKARAFEAAREERVGSAAGAQAGRRQALETEATLEELVPLRTHLAILPAEDALLRPQLPDESFREFDHVRCINPRVLVRRGAVLPAGLQRPKPEEERRGWRC